MAIKYLFRKLALGAMVATVSAAGLIGSGTASAMSAGNHDNDYYINQLKECYVPGPAAEYVSAAVASFWRKTGPNQGVITAVITNVYDDRANDAAPVAPLEIRKADGTLIKSFGVVDASNYFDNTRIPFTLSDNVSLYWGNYKQQVKLFNTKGNSCSVNTIKAFYKKF